MTQFILIMWIVWVFSHAAEESQSEKVYNRHYDD